MNIKPPYNSPSTSIGISYATRSSRLQLRLDGALQALGLGGARPPALNLPVLSDQELLEVPLDALQTHDSGLALLHPFVHGLDVVAVDFGLAQHGERDAVVDLAEGLDFVVGAGILAAELVAWEADDFEVGVVWLHLWSRR
jgi:hypothetical protein